MDSAPVHAVIRFDSDSNISKNDFFARTELLMANTSTMTNVAYIPEVQGKFNNELSFVTKFNVGQLASATRVAKLPADNSKHYKVEYTYNSSIRNAFRSGTLDINIDRTVDTVNLSDEYDFLGDTANNTNSTRLNFTASLSDENSDGAKEIMHNTGNQSITIIEWKRTNYIQSLEVSHKPNIFFWNIPTKTNWLEKY